MRSRVACVRAHMRAFHAPQMLGSLVLLRRSFSSRDWLAALMLVTGVVCFNLSNAMPATRQQTFRGSACIGVALTCDALLGNFQQKVPNHRDQRTS